MTIRRVKLDLRETGYCASFNFRRTARAITRLYDGALQHAGIRSTQFTILVAIAKFQPVPIGTLADALITDPTTLSRNLRLLKIQGLITISGRSTMRRRFLTITQEGQAVLARSLPIWRNIHKHFLTRLGSSRWTELRHELESIARFATEDATKDF